MFAKFTHNMVVEATQESDDLVAGIGRVLNTEFGENSCAVTGL